MFMKMKELTKEEVEFRRKEWRPQGDLNPCNRRERAGSWTARRWGRT